MTDYTFLSAISDLEGKTIKKAQTINFSGIIRTVFLTEDDCVYAERHSPLVYDGERYIENEIFTNLEELFRDVDQEVIGILISEKEYKELTKKQDAADEQQALEEEKEAKRSRKELYLELKKEFEEEG